ncbi:hypothetical protein, partial [Streptomyces beijiangensis]
MNAFRTAETTRRGWGFFAAWAVVGAGFALALLTVLSIGLFVLPVAAGLALLLVRLKGSERGLPGIVSGLSAPLLYVAYLNRSGPGTVCTRSGTGEMCEEQWNPWLWLAAALIAVVGGVVVMLAVRRRQEQPHRQ